MDKQGMDQKEGKEEDEENGCCCMCGDVGFSDQLRRCPACRTRLQHAYCSTMYPEIDMTTWQCEWCLHESNRQKQQQQKQSTGTTIIRLKKRHRDKEDAAERRHFVSSNTVLSAKKQHLQEQKESSSMPPPPPRNCNGDRWRKPGCNSSSSSSPRVAGRRYRLLADVLLC